MLKGRLDYKETHPLHLKGNQVWIHIRKTTIGAETPILWPLDAKSWLIWKLLWFACECGNPTWAQGLRGHCHWIMTSKQAHSSCVTLSTQETGTAVFFGGRKGIHRECVFRPLFAASMFAQTSDLQAWSKGLNSRVRAMCLCAHSEPCKHIPGSEQCCLWGRRLQECVWGGWVPCWSHLVESTLHIQWALGEELWTGPLLEISQSNEQS